MKFKLRRFDCVVQTEFPLDIGEHDIGRDGFLQCDDKRISRKHAVLKVTSDSVTLTALHTNPCFLIKKTSGDTVIMRKGESQELQTNGDKFGLLPGIYWYELLHAEDGKPGHGPETTAAIPSTGAGGSGSDDEIDLHLEESLVEAKERLDGAKERVESPSLLGEESTSDPGTKKRCNTEPCDSDDVKRVKSENEASEGDGERSVTVKAEPGAGESVTVKQEAADELEDVKPTRQQLDATVALAGGRSPSPDIKPAAAAPTRLRERCMYGAGCYRRNPAHRLEYSHPGEAAWGSGPTAPCPWGLACRRTDPRHHRDHHHPPGYAPPDPSRPRGGAGGGVHVVVVGGGSLAPCCAAALHQHRASVHTHASCARSAPTNWEEDEGLEDWGEDEDFGDWEEEDES